MTIAQSLKLAIVRLNAGDITDNPHLEAEILLSKILKKPREFLLTHPEHKLTKLQITNYKLQIKKRLKRLPLAYITGEKEFYGLKFKVNKNVLIPRPETELMVEEALKLVTHSSQHVTIIDVGTGSGCVIITLAKLLSQESRIMNHELWGIDISKKALTVARQNAKLHGVTKNIKFIKGNLLSPIIHNSSFIIHNSLVILANLPYLTPFQIKNSPTIKYEPESALVGGTNGLKYHRQLLKQIRQLINSRKFVLNSRIFALLEIDAGQTAKIKQLIKRELPQATSQTKKDLAGLNRLVIIKIPSPWQGEG